MWNPQAFRRLETDIVLALASLAVMGALSGGVYAQEDPKPIEHEEGTREQEPEQPEAQTSPSRIPDEEMREPERILTGADLTADDFPGSWPMFGTDYRMKIGGYVKADYLYDFAGTLDRQQFLMSTIPVEGTPEHANGGYLSLFAGETRFNIDVRRIEEDGPPLKLFVEGDFWPSGKAFRLRHAYVVFGNFLAGQTWTTLSVLESMPLMIDFAAGDALFGGRSAQLRYQRRVNDRWKFAVAIESLDLMGIENSTEQAGEPSLGLPLLAVKVDRTWDGGFLVLGSSFAQLRWDGGATGRDAHALQWDALVAGRQYLGSDFVTWNLSYGHGSGENIIAFAGSDANAVLTSDGRLERMPAFSFLLGYAHKWNERLSSNLSYAYGWLETPDSRAPGALKRGGIGHANVIWRPVSKFSTGLELMYGAQRTSDDSFGEAVRLQGMVRLDF